MNTQIDERMKAILIMFQLSHKRLPKDLLGFIYTSLKLAYMDGRISALEQALRPEHIDGISGEEEYLALNN